MNDIYQYLKIGVLLFSVLYIIYILSEAIVNWISYESYAITIKSKERILHKNKSYYLIFTSEEVFKNTDAWYFGKFKSSDIYRDLEVGKSYLIKVSGYRVPMFSEYRNIIKVIKEL